MRGKHWLAVAVVTGLLLVGAGSGCRLWPGHEEHPTGHFEHPGSTHEAEHPGEQPGAAEELPAEHPTGGEHPTSAAPTGAVFAQVAQPRPGILLVAEHPAEHPAEHLKPPVKKPKPLTKEDLGKAIEGYITQDTELKGGYFLVYDKEKEEVLMLTLDKVHKDRLSQTAPRTYFACTDLKTPEGKVYDLDFWMKQDEEGNVNVTQIMVHKEAGKPRYNWVKEGDIWKQRPVK